MMTAINELLTIERNPLQQKVYDSTIASGWSVSEIFIGTPACDFGNEENRLHWAAPIFGLAFGELAALHSFAPKIHQETDLKLKTWLIAHLADEARHCQGFAHLLRYLYPTKLESIKNSTQREIIRYYGKTKRCSSIAEWLICTHVIEVYGMACYRSLTSFFADDPVAREFLTKVIGDEGRHIAFLNSVVKEQISSQKPSDNTLNTHVAEMADLCEEIFLRKKSPIFKGFEAMEISPEAICSKARSDLMERLYK